MSTKLLRLRPALVAAIGVAVVALWVPVRDVAAQAYEAGIKQRIVIVEFESVAKAVEAHDSPE